MNLLTQEQSDALDSAINNPSTRLIDAIREIYCSSNAQEERLAVSQVRRVLHAQLSSNGGARNG